MSSILESLNSYRHEMLKHRQKNNNLISSSKGSLFYKSPRVLTNKRKSNWSPVIKDNNAWRSKLGIVLSLSKNERRYEESPNKIKFSVDSEGLNSHRSSRSLGIWRFCSPKKRIKTYKVDSAKLLYDRVIAYLEKHFKSGKSNSPLELYKLPLRTDTYLSKKQRLENIKINLEKKFQEREEKLKAKQSNEDKTLFFTPQSYSEIELSHSPGELNEIIDIQLSAENKARLNETFNSNILTPREYESTQLEDVFLDKLSSDSMSLAPPSSYSSRFDKEKNFDSGRMVPISYEKLIGIEIICRYCFKVIIQAFDGFKNSYSPEPDDDFFEYFIFDKPLLDYDYLEEPDYYDEETNIEVTTIRKSDLHEPLTSQAINELCEVYVSYEDNCCEQNDEIFEYRDIKKTLSSYNCLEESNEINKEIEYSIIDKPESDYNYLEESNDINKEHEYSNLKKPRSDYEYLEEYDTNRIEIDNSKTSYQSTITHSIINSPPADYNYLLLKPNTMYILYDHKKTLDYHLTNKPIADFNYLEEDSSLYISKSNPIYQLTNKPIADFNYLEEDTSLYISKSNPIYQLNTKPIADYNYLEEDSSLYISKNNPTYHLNTKPIADYSYLEEDSSLYISKSNPTYHLNTKPIADYNYLEEDSSLYISKRNPVYHLANKSIADYNYLEEDSSLYISKSNPVYHLTNKSIADYNYLEEDSSLYIRKHNPVYHLTNKSIADYNYLKDYSSFEYILSKVFNKSSFRYNSLKAKYWTKLSSRRVISYFVLNKPQPYFNLLKDDVSYQQILSQAINKLNSHYNFIKKKYWNQWLCSYVFTLSSLSSGDEFADISMHKETIAKAINNFNAYYAFLNVKYWDKWVLYMRISILKENSIRKIARSISKSQGKLKFSFFLKLLSYIEKRKYALCVFKTLFHKREKQIIDFWYQISSKTPIVNNEHLFIEELNMSTSHIDSDAVEKFYKPLEFLYKSKLRAGFSSLLSLLIKTQKPPVNLSNISVYKYRMIKEKIEKFLACLETKVLKTSNIYFQKWKSL